MMNLKLSLAVAVALLPALAMAADPVEMQIVGKLPAPNVVVYFGDLNLATPEGTHVLNARLGTAAWQVCSQMIPNVVSIEGGKCRAELIDAAKADVNHREALIHGANAPILR
jgi:UrcA family protein